MTAIVTLVPSDHVLEMWPKVAGFMRKATKYTNGRYEAEDILDQLLYEDYSLWIAFEDGEVKGAVITRFSNYPRKRYLFLEFCGGVDGFHWKDAMLSMLRSWAKDNGCDGLEGLGRLGWKKIFEGDGYRPLLHSFELALS